MTEHTKHAYVDIATIGPHRIFACSGCDSKYRQTEAYGHYWRQYWDKEDDRWGVKLVWPVSEGWEPPPVDLDGPAEWKNHCATYEAR